MIPVFAPKFGLAGVIAGLFANGEQGVWYDPSDFRTMFQDAAGTTPVTAVEQQVGKMLDKSGRGNHATQATTTKRPTLKQDANGRYYLSFDGVDDGMQTGNIDFTGTDKMTVVAGVRKLSDAAIGFVAELSTTSANAGAFQLRAPGGAGSNTYLWGSGGSVLATINVPNQIAPISGVITGTSDIAAPLTAVRVNGVAINSSASTQGVGNFGSYPLFIGARAGSSFFFNGHLYSLIIRGAQSSEAQILSAETYCNQKTGAY